MIKKRNSTWMVGIGLLLLLAACGQLPGSGTAPTAPAATAMEAANSTEEGAVADAGAAPTPQTAASPTRAAIPEATQPPDPDQPTGTPGGPVSDAPPTEAPPPPTPVPANYNTAIILDASGSMLADLGGQTRLQVAQDAIGSLSAGLPASINASLWVYGHRVDQADQSASCQDIEQVIPLGPVDARLFDTTAHSFPAKGYTPITNAILLAAQSLPVGPTEHNTIILVSDGEETCGGDPCALAAELAASEIQLVIHTIGLAVDPATQAQLQCIAEATGGAYTDAQDADSLTQALEEAAQAAANDTFTLVEGLQRPNVVLVSPDNRHVYVASFVGESVLVFERDPATGGLAFRSRQQNRVNGVERMDSPLGMAISPDGNHLYVSGDQEFTVVIFHRDQETGDLTYVETVEAFDKSAGLTGMRGLAVSPDGLNVYATGWHNGQRDDAIAVLQRDPATGKLNRIQVLHNGENGVEGLAGLAEVIISPDGRHVYFSSSGRRLVVFARDASGQLTQIQLLQQGADLPDGLLDGNYMAFSPDGERLYLAAGRRGVLTMFHRDPESGLLTFSSQVFDHTGPPAGDPARQNLTGARGLAISPDGLHLYATSGNNDFLVALTLDPTTNGMVFLEQFKDNEGGIDGLENGYAVAVSPDGLSVYVTGFDDNSLAVFRRDPNSGRLTFVEVIRNSEK